MVMKTVQFRLDLMYGQIVEEAFKRWWQDSFGDPVYRTTNQNDKRLSKFKIGRELVGAPDIIIFKVPNDPHYIAIKAKSSWVYKKEHGLLTGIDDKEYDTLIRLHNTGVKVSLVFWHDGTNRDKTLLQDIENPIGLYMNDYTYLRSNYIDHFKSNITVWKKSDLKEVLDFKSFMKYIKQAEKALLELRGDIDLYFEGR